MRVTRGDQVYEVDQVDGVDEVACEARTEEVLTLPCLRPGDARGRGIEIISRFRHIAWVKCPYRVARKASALRAGKRAPG